MMRGYDSDEDFEPSKFAKLAKATRRISSLVLPPDRVSSIRQFVREWGFRDKLRRYGIPPRSSLLLHGPSGNGKTAIGECIAAEIGVPYGVIQSAALIDPYLGGATRNVHELMEWVNRVNAVLLFDECDSLFAKRQSDQATSREMGRVVNEMLTSMDALNQSSVLIFATNYAERLDPAFVRRIGLKLAIDPPTIVGKEELISRLLKRWEFIEDGDWRARALNAPNFAECEQVVMNVARRMIVAGEV